MRTLLLPGLLENVKRNLSFQQTDVKLFEIGKVFTPTDDNEQPIEKTRLAGVLSGNTYGNSSELYFKPQQVDIFDAKGAVEFLLEQLRLMGVSASAQPRFSIPSPEQTETFSDKKQSLILSIEDRILGTLGKVTKEVLKRFGIKNEVFYFDLDFEALSKLAATSKAFSSLPIYPAVKRDIALVLPQHVSACELLEAVDATREKLIEHCEIFDIYTGKPIKEGYKSVALSITYRSATKTLTEKNVEKSHQKIVATLTDKFQGSFREA